VLQSNIITPHQHNTNRISNSRTTSASDLKATKREREREGGAGTIQGAKRGLLTPI
jgi:hypothetical protein